MRALLTDTLDLAAADYAGQFLLPTVFSAKVSDRAIGGRDWVMSNFYNAHFKDEFDYLLAAFRENLGARPLADFDKLAKARFEPRDDEMFRHLLETKRAIDPDGKHITGKIGTSQVNGRRYIGTHLIEVETPESIVRHRRLLALGQPFERRRETYMKTAARYWNIYAGETEERIAGSGVADDLPPGTPGMPVGALNTRISNECAQLGANAIVDNLDEGSVGAVIEGREGAQPADPDTVVSGDLLFQLNADDATTFGAASDGNPGGLKTAGTIDDDISANDTGTLGYCRASSANSLDTPLDDHVDGEAATPTGGDFNFNTLAIVGGATVSLTSWTITMPEG